MHSVTFLQDLAVVMIVAGLVTLICHRFKQPVVLGYIIAGVIIGPYTPPAAFIHDKQTIDTLAELGIILLMFSLGLEFNLRKLTKVGASAIIAALMDEEPQSGDQVLLLGTRCQLDSARAKLAKPAEAG